MDSRDSGQGSSPSCVISAVEMARRVRNPPVKMFPSGGPRLGRRPSQPVEDGVPRRVRLTRHGHRFPDSGEHRCPKLIGKRLGRDRSREQDAGHRARHVDDRALVAGRGRPPVEHQRDPRPKGPDDVRRGGGRRVGKAIRGGWRGTTSVSGPCQNRAARRSAASGHSAASAWAPSIDATWAMTGFQAGRPIAAWIAATARG